MGFLLLLKELDLIKSLVGILLPEIPVRIISQVHFLVLRCLIA